MIDFSIKNPLLVNLFLILILLLGILSWQSMPEEMFPVVEKDRIKITTSYDGASPEEIEQQVSIPIEDALDNMQDIDFYYSHSKEGISIVTLVLKPDSNIEELMREVRDLVDAIDDFPVEADQPAIIRVKTRFPVISVSLFGDARDSLLFEQSKIIKQKLLQLSGVAGVGISGNREKEIWVEINPEEMSARNISSNLIIEALRSNIKDLPGGSIKSIEGDILLRGIGMNSVEKISKINLRNNESGGQLLLGEVAKVKVKLEEVKSLGRFNSRNAVNLTVTKTADASVFDVSNSVRDLVKKYNPPGGLKLAVYSDFSKNVKTRLDTVKSSGVIGLILLLISLYIFLNSRVAFVTAFGVPVSFLFAAIGMYVFGFTINMVSLFAFLVALGMIVDDAIIVTENTYRHIENGLNPTDAAKKGVREVFWPVVASTLTTIAAFLPMFAITGVLGKFIEVIPVVVSVALIGSLIEAFVVLPSHCSQFLKPQQAKKNYIDWSKFLSWYKSILSKAIKNKYLVSSITVGVLAVVIAIAITRIPYYQFGKVDNGVFFVNVEGPITNSIYDTEKLALNVEKEIKNELEDFEVESILTNVGLSFKDMSSFSIGSQYIQIIVSLSKRSPQGFVDKVVTPLLNLNFSNYGQRDRSEKEITNNIRQRILA